MKKIPIKIAPMKNQSVNGEIVEDETEKFAEVGSFCGTMILYPMFDSSVINTVKDKDESEGN